MIRRGRGIHSLLIKLFLKIIEYLETLLEKLSVLLKLIASLISILASACRPIQMEDAELVEHGDVLLQLMVTPLRFLRCDLASSTGRLCFLGFDLFRLTF